MKSNFNEKKEARIEAYKRLSEKNKTLSNETYEQAHKMSSIIPFGQPILIGHHSEKGHRRLLDRIHNKMGQSVELGQKARYYENRAEAAESNTAIFSDDPEALRKLKEKLAQCEKNQTQYKKINALLKKKDIEGLKGFGLTDTEILKYQTGDFCGRTGIPSYVLQNNNAEIRRLKQRIEKESIKNTQQTSSVEIGNVKIVDNVEDNRVQIYFPGKPSDATRSALKSNGFRWAPSIGAWQKHRGVNNRYLIEEIRKIVM